MAFPANRRLHCQQTSLATNLIGNMRCTPWPSADRSIGFGIGDSMRARLVPLPEKRTVVIDHDFLGRSDDQKCWARWLKQVEHITGLSLERLDTRDP
jgi:hypothetical protein